MKYVLFYESDPENIHGSMAIFSTRASAEAFAKDDPFVVHGVVKDWRIQEWNEVLG